MSRIYVNDYSSTINGAILSTDTTIVLTSATGLPTLSAGQFYYLTLTDYVNYEIIKVTARSTVTLSGITRSMEGTTAQAWPGGTFIGMMFTAASMNGKVDIPSDVTTGKVLQSDGTSYKDSSFTMESPSSSGKIQQSDGTNWKNSSFTIANPGTSGNALISDGTNWISSPSGGGGGGGITALTGDVTASGTGSVVATFAANPTFTGTAHMIVPAGTTAQRGTTNDGFRINTDTSHMEFRLAGSYSGLQLLQDADFSNGIPVKTAALTYSTVTMTGTTNSITVTNGAGTAGNPTFAISSTYPGQSSITVVGTIATGTWQGTAIANSYIANGAVANLSGTNTGDQTITLTGDITGSGTSSFAATIANSSVTLAKQANMATASLVYRKTAGSGAPEINTLATLKTDLLLTGTNSGDQVSVLRSFQVFTSGTAATYTKPAGINTIFVEVIGGGGAGGGSAGGSSALSVGAGGGAGGYAALLVTSPSGTYTYTVGAGGTAGTAGNNAGNTGGTTTFSASSLQATGGVGGGGCASSGTVANSVGGAGGVGSNGTINLNGSTGGGSVVINGSLGAGFCGVSAASKYGAGVITTSVGAGSAGANYGSGGAGAISQTTSSAGGAGSAGLIVVWEFN